MLFTAKFEVEGLDYDSFMQIVEAIEREGSQLAHFETVAVQSPKPSTYRPGAAYNKRPKRDSGKYLGDLTVPDPELLDDAGTPWCQEVHATSKKKYVTGPREGKWRLARRFHTDWRDEIEAKLRDMIGMEEGKVTISGEEVEAVPPLPTDAPEQPVQAVEAVAPEAPSIAYMEFLQALAANPKAKDKMAPALQKHGIIAVTDLADPSRDAVRYEIAAEVGIV